MNLKPSSIALEPVCPSKMHVKDLAEATDILVAQPGLSHQAAGLSNLT